MFLLDSRTLLWAFEELEGFPAPVRDQGALESAVHRQNVSMYGVALYPTLDLKVAALMDGIARSHPLLDGNKRLAAIAALVTFPANGRPHRVGTVDEWETFVLRVSGEHLEVPEVAEWLSKTFTAMPPST